VLDGIEQPDNTETDMQPEEFAGILRALIAGIGGAAVAAGKADPATVETIAGATAVVGAAGWSIWSKRRAR
jgi:hypothetical protein